MHISRFGLASLFTALALAAGSVSAGIPSIQGDVKGPDGKALSGAEVRLQHQGDTTAKVVKTDAKGRYVFNNLSLGTFNLTTSATGMATTAAQSVTTSNGGAVRVDFHLKKQSGTVATSTAKKKKYVWVDAEIGSHIGGRWVEVPDDGSAVSGTANASESIKKQDSIRRMVNDGGGLTRGGN
jgi:hypothetical protein